MTSSQQPAASSKWIADLIYLQCMLSEMRFETDGGTPLEAMHRYEPISLREIFVSLSTSPRNEETVIGPRKRVRERELYR